MGGRRVAQPKRAPKRTPRYRGSGGKRARSDEALREALELLANNDAASMARARAPSLAERVRGKFTWASVGEWAASEVGARLLERAALEESVDEAKELMTRLQQRDGARNARVTTALRDKITLVHAVAVTLDELTRVADGTLRASYDTAGRASALLTRWVRLGGQKAGWARALMETATAEVLGDPAASAGLKASYTRALAAWLPPPGGGGSAAPAGERVEWTDADDLL